MIDNFEDIQKPFRIQLATVIGTTRVAWENTLFTPLKGETFVKEDLMHGLERPTATNAITQGGIMQYSVLAPVGTGTKAVKDKADAIKQAFKAGAVLSNKVYINSASVVNGVQSDEWYSLLVQISYNIYAPNH